MSNKFPGFVEITPEHARSIQYDIQLYVHWPLNRYFGRGCLPSASAFSIEDRRTQREKGTDLGNNYWVGEEGNPKTWYIRIDDSKPEYSPTTTDTQHQ